MRQDRQGVAREPAAGTGDVTVPGRGRFWLPGPVELHPEVAAAQAGPVFGHRTPAAAKLLERIQTGIRPLFGTDRPVLMLAGSGSAMMEAAIRSGVRERILCIVNGTFGERFARIAEGCGREVIRLNVAPGRAVTRELMRAMRDSPPVDAVSLVHVETSTGVVTPVEEVLDEIGGGRDLVTIVDAVASVGGMPVDGIVRRADMVLTASQKALGLPPGLAFAVAGERMLERARQADDRGWYLDVVALWEAARDGRFPATPPVPVVNALALQLERIGREGMANRFARHRRMREMVEEWAGTVADCRLLAESGFRADTVSVLELAPGRSAAALMDGLASDGWHVAGGNLDGSDRMIRIGHMGDAAPDDLAALLEAIGRRLG